MKEELQMIWRDIKTGWWYLKLLALHAIGIIASLIGYLGGLGFITDGFAFYRATPTYWVCLLIALIYTGWWYLDFIRTRIKKEKIQQQRNDTWV